MDMDMDMDMEPRVAGNSVAHYHLRLGYPSFAQVIQLKERSFSRRSL